MDISAIALSGLERAQTAFDASATRLSRAALPQDTPAVDSVDLSSAVVGLMTAQNNFKVNVKVAQTADDMQRATLDILA
jgi:hypothetical protein